MLVAHSIATVWRAITDADALAEWFGDFADVEPFPGGKANFGWSEYGTVISGRVEVVSEPHTFAFRWSAVEGVPFDDAPSTLVTFSLTDEEGKTLVKVVETGFSELPADIQARSLEENTSGLQAESGAPETFLSSRER